MSRHATETQHQCSCGRTFRHGISLKRHQKVSGCSGAEMVAAVPSTAPPSPLCDIVAPQPVAPAEAVAVKAAAPEDAPLVLVTAQQIALWQEQKNVTPSALPTAATAPHIDWDGVRQSCRELASFSLEQCSSAGRALGSLLQVVTRFVVFTGFLAALGYLALFGLSRDLMAAPATAVDRVQAAEMAATSTVNSFLRTGQLQQLERARGFLTVTSQQSIADADLQALFAGLPLEQAPESVTSTLEQDGRVAKVTLVRNGASEVYTLVEESQGWSLASVALRRS